MKVLKNFVMAPKEKQGQSYNTLSGCLEAYFGDRHTSKTARVTTLVRNVTHSGTDRKYCEPEQGFKTIPFESLPLQLNYMQRRKNGTLTHLLRLR